MTESQDLLEGWQLISLGQILNIQYGKGLPKRLREESGSIAVYGSNGVIGQHTTALTQGPTIIIGRKGSVGEVHFCPIPCWPIDTTFFIDHFPDGLDPKYLTLFLKSQDLRSLDVHAAIPGMRRDDLSRVGVPLPYPDEPPRSLETQRRIVTRIEALFAEVRAARELHQEVVKDTERLMEAVLAEAYSQSDNWDHTTIVSFAQVKGGKRLPKGESFANAPTDHPYLRVVDFKDYSIDATAVKYLKPETYARIQRYTISSDDIYISIAGTIGLVGTVPPELSGSNLTENAAKLVILPLFRQEVNTRYVVYYLASPYGRAQIEARTKMAGQPKLALMRIKTIEVPFPKTSTAQLRIVKYVDTAMAEVREMQKTQADDSRLLDQMEEAILDQAFRGEL